MTINQQIRATRAEDVSDATFSTTTGNKGLQIEEGLIFEVGDFAGTGVDLEKPEGLENRLGGVTRDSAIGLPGLSEPQTMRHFVRLSQKNYAIDMGPFPLGSCTMKHNPRLNEKIARMPGFADLHPLTPISAAQGALELIDRLAFWLKELTGMPAVAMSPKAGAHGELCGMMAIKAAIIARGEADQRVRVLAPESAHGTNPATAVQCGFKVEAIPADETGRVDVAELKAKLGPDIAGIMVTNPNTCGLFERDIREIADAVHEAGGYFYCDGANFNALVGKIRPGDFGVDVMHLNLHKTFSTPHGGGGPGSGPICVAKSLEPYIPSPLVVKDGDEYRLERDGERETTCGRLKGFHGQFGMHVRALSYMMSHGADGLKQVSEDAVLNANYINACLKDDYHAPFEGPVMHEALFTEKYQKESNVTTLDIAKGLIEYGMHPMTVYFPLVVNGAMLIEPTETESKAELDRFILVMKKLAEDAKTKGPDYFHDLPTSAPATRLDEVKAAREPVLRWSEG